MQAVSDGDAQRKEEVMYLRVVSVKLLTETKDEPTLGPVTDFVPKGTPLKRGFPEIVEYAVVGDAVELTEEEVVQLRTDAYKGV